MSQITDNYDTIVTRVTAVLSNHKRLMNPYELELNDRKLLQQGFGVGFGGMSNPNNNIGTQVGFDRTIIVAITREAFGREFERDKKASTEKSLINDQLLVVTDLCNQIPLLTFAGDDGIEFVFGDENRGFLALQTAFTVRTCESLV